MSSEISADNSLLLEALAIAGIIEQLRNRVFEALQEAEDPALHFPVFANELGQA